MTPFIQSQAFLIWFWKDSQKPVSIFRIPRVSRLWSAGGTGEISYLCNPLNIVQTRTKVRPHPIRWAGREGLGYTEQTRLFSDG